MLSGFIVHCILYINITLLYLHKRTIFDAGTWNCDNTKATSLRLCGARNEEVAAIDFTFPRGTVCFLTVVGGGNDDGRMNVVVCVYFKRVGYTSITLTKRLWEQRRQRQASEQDTRLPSREK